MKFIEQIRKIAEQNIIYTIHSLEEMNDEEELITTDEIREVIFDGEIIEDYPEDKRGHSCLMFAMTKKERPLHILVAPKADYLAIITTYIPSEKKWERNYKTRKK